LLKYFSPAQAALMMILSKLCFSVVGLSFIDTPRQQANFAIVIWTVTLLSLSLSLSRNARKNQDTPQTKPKLEVTSWAYDVNLKSSCDFLMSDNILMVNTSNLI